MGEDRITLAFGWIGQPCLIPPLLEVLHAAIGLHVDAYMTTEGVKVRCLRDEMNAADNIVSAYQCGLRTASRLLSPAPSVVIDIRQPKATGANDSHAAWRERQRTEAEASGLGPFAGYRAEGA